jgi:iron complex transport system substrate-binding protein
MFRPGVAVLVHVMMKWLLPAWLRFGFISVACVFSLVAHANEQPIRVVSLGGSVTEIVYALGAQDLLVGVDQSSLYPPEAQSLPSVGYYRRLPPEGVASLKPTLVLASAHAGPPQIIDQLTLLGIDVLQLSDEPTVQSLESRVMAVAQALGKQAQGRALLAQFHLAWSQAQAQATEPMSAMMVVMRAGRLLGAGGDTNASVVLTQSGLTNALAAQRSYQPISAEAVSALAPQVLIVTTSTVQSMGSLEAVKAHPALRLTPAVRNNRVVVLDDLLAQGFGLRVTQAIDLIRKEVNRADRL